MPLHKAIGTLTRSRSQESMALSIFQSRRSSSFSLFQ